MSKKFGIDAFNADFYRRQIIDLRKQNSKLAQLLDKSNTVLKIVSLGIRRDKKKNMCWLTGEALAVHAIEKILKELEKYIKSGK